MLENNEKVVVHAHVHKVANKIPEQSVYYVDWKVFYLLQYFENQTIHTFYYTFIIVYYHWVSEWIG